MVILLLAAGVAALLAAAWLADRRMAQMARREVDDLLRAAEAGAPAAPADLAGLPPPVQRYLERAVPEGAPRIRSAHLTQRGHMRPALGMPWLPMTAEQWFTAAPPGFVWRARARLAPLLWVAARDKYAHGAGEMLIKPLSLFTLARAGGPATDSGALLRYMAEMAWFPTALLPRPGLRWEPVDDHSARLIVADSGQTLDLLYHFDAAGDLERVEGLRYLGSGPAAKLEKWQGSHSDWREFQGLRIPTRAEVRWTLAAGDFVYFRAQIETLELDLDPAGTPAR